MKDSEIIALLNNRDEAAVEALKDRFGGLCFSLASNILADRRDAEECVSSVLFKLWSSIPPGRSKGSYGIRRKDRPKRGADEVPRKLRQTEFCRVRSA